MNILDIFEDIVSYLNKGESKFLELSKKNIILFLIDGMTTKQASKLSDNIKTIKSLSIPSTAPVITSINLLRYPGEHGIYSWFVYSELFKEIIKPLPYTTEKGNINTKHHLLLEDFETIYQRVRSKSFVLIPREYKDSTYSHAIYKGSEIIGYRTLSEVIQKIKEIVRENKDFFIYIYYDRLDSINHKYGPNSKYSLEEIRFLKFFTKRLTKVGKNCQIIITADHGAIRLNKRKQIKIDKIKEDTEFIVGEQRNIFIKPKDGFEDKILEYLEENLKKKKIDATLKILDKKEIEKLLGKYTEKVKHLEGCVFLQMKDNGFVKRFEDSYIGDHGGASKEELKIPLIVL